jgi:hypothetical protein
MSIYTYQLNIKNGLVMKFINIYCFRDYWYFINTFEINYQRVNITQCFSDREGLPLALIKAVIPSQVISDFYFFYNQLDPNGMKKLI